MAWALLISTVRLVTPDGWPALIRFQPVPPSRLAHDTWAPCEVYVARTFLLYSHAMSVSSVFAVVPHTTYIV